MKSKFIAVFQESLKSLQNWLYDHHSHKKRKDSLEERAVLLIFSLELESVLVAVERIHQNSKKWWLCEKLLSENDFEAVLAAFYCYGCGTNVYEAVQEIATDQKDYYKCSSRVIVC